MKYLDELRQEISKIMTLWNIPGVAIGINQERNNLFEAYYGVEDIDSKTSITKDTVFCIASIGKLFVSVAVMHLVETGKIHLSDLIIKYIPNLEFQNNKYKQINIEMLLSHRSGLPDLNMDEYLFLLGHPELSMHEYMNMMANHELLEPGISFRYSNFGYAILSEIISFVSHKSFKQYMKEDILDRLGMHHSFFGYPNDFKDIAFPHLRVPDIIKSEKYPYSEVEAASSFMHTTISDMMNFYVNIHNLISKEAFQNMITPRSLRGYPPFYMHTGLGINIGNLDD